MKKKIINEKTGEIDEALLLQIAREYTPPIRTSKNLVDYHTFEQYIGAKKNAKINSPIGKVTYDAKYQFWKMIKAKENRRALLFNVRETIEDPIAIIEEDDSYKFISAYKKKDNSLFCMVVVAKKEENKLNVKTSYQTRGIGKLRSLIERRGTLLYEHKEISITRKKKGWDLLSELYPESQSMLEKEKMEFVISKVISMDKTLNNTKGDIPDEVESLQKENNLLKEEIEKLNTILTKVTRMPAEEKLEATKMSFKN